jgi:hypothetical protein
MDEAEFSEWLEHYRQAWENRDPQAAARLFSRQATYQETPFDVPMQGEAEIVEYWSEVPRSQQAIQFSWQVLAVSGQTGIAHWQARFWRVPDGPQVHLDGVLVAEFDPEGLCRVFREWWHRQEG